MRAAFIRWGLRLLRVGVTLALLTYVVRRAGGGALVAEFAKLSALSLVAATICSAVFFILATLRWRILISPAPPSLTFPALLRAYLLSYFYGALGPGTLGLDAVRTLTLARHGTGRTAAAVSVTADRIVGLLGLATLSAPMLWAVASRGQIPSGAVALPHALADIVRKATAAIRTLIREPWRLVVSFAVTLVALTVWAGVGWWTLQALGAPLPFPPLIAIIAFGELASAIPISVQGIGVREFVFTTALAGYGISSADATLLGLLLYGQGLGLTCVGALVALLSRDSLVLSAAERANKLA